MSSSTWPHFPSVACGELGDSTSVAVLLVAPKPRRSSFVIRHHGQPGDEVVRLHPVGVIFADVAKQLFSGAIQQHKGWITHGLTVKFVAARYAKSFGQLSVGV